MRKPGVFAFPVLLVLGAVTGYLAYDWMVVKATPVEGIYDNSPYRKEIPQAPAAQNQDTEPAENSTADEQQLVDETPAENESESSSVVTISILKGSSVQGQPDYDPDTATVPLDATIRWVNDDTQFHTATYGTSSADKDYGSLFDTGFLGGGKEYTIAASEIGTGEYSYFCQAHPFMVGTLIIE